MRASYTSYIRSSLISPSSRMASSWSKPYLSARALTAWSTDAWHISLTARSKVLGILMVNIAELIEFGCWILLIFLACFGAFGLLRVYLWDPLPLL